jgi:peptidyl-prolyl cis-trans isomerase B (cyclophilin B)
VVRLYDKTPLHRDNFIKLVNSHFYDSLLFHRIIAGFMIQGGDPESKNAVPDQMLGKGDIGYTIPAEFDSTLFHKKGALAAARTNNPEKASSGCQFYLVQGKKMTEQELSTIENQTGI